MKIILKITLLVVAIILAVGGIMIYAKTKVNPPTDLKQINQYTQDLDKSCDELTKLNNINEQDALYYSMVDRINLFEKENKLSAVDADKCIDKLLGKYCPLFLSQCFDKFKQSVWFSQDHTDILVRISALKSQHHSDNTNALKSSTLDSLNLVCDIIANYRQANKISRCKSFTGVINAQSTINQSKRFIRNKYLCNCSDLMNSLSNVQSSIGQSHYNFVLAQIEKLTQYQFYSKSYYEETLVPYINAVTTEYDNKAVSLYGNKKDVDSLWATARNYYDQAMVYYGSN